LRTDGRRAKKAAEVTADTLPKADSIQKQYGMIILNPSLQEIGVLCSEIHIV
jgi:hypothetical protein